MDNGVALPTAEKNRSAGNGFTGEIPVFKVSGVFSSHMVLQRDNKIKIWGFADKDGIKVTGTFDGDTACAEVKNNRFELVFPKRGASSSPLCMEISDERGNTVSFDDILVGDVWLIGGQSNAELNLAPCLTATPVDDFDESADFRLFMQTQCYPFTHQEFCGCPQPEVINPEWRWKRPDKEASLTFSAVGWFFAEEVSRKLGVPIGVINVSAGGACIRELVPEELAAEMGYDFGANVRQGGYYNTLINPFVGLPFSGMIFFQGESEGIWKDQAERYDKELSMLVADERRRFGFDFPFFNIQLSDYRGEGLQYFPYLDIVRMKQFDALKLIKNSYLTVAMDLGSPKDHPDFAHSPLKKALTARVSSLVLAAYYGIGDPSDAGSPVPVSTVTESGIVTVKFKNVSGGLKSRSGTAEVAGFTFGEYGSLTPAKAVITGADTVVVYVPENTEAKQLNYAFSVVITEENAQLIKDGGLPCPAFSLKL